MVSFPVRVTNLFSFPYSHRLGPGRELPHAQGLPSSGVHYWIQSCRAKGLSRAVAICGLKSVVRKTLVSYQRCWARFSSWYNKWQGNYSAVTVADVCEFLLFLFNSGSDAGKSYTSDALNTFRSALSFFLKLDFPDLGYDARITRLFASFYKQRPSFPRYVVTWDVGVVLRFLASWHPPSSLSLKQLTLKTVALVALTASDRAQTIHALRSDMVEATGDGLVIVVYDLLKTSRRGHPPRVVTCVTWDAPELDVSLYVHKYLDRVLRFRIRAVRQGLEKPVQLFLSHKTGLPVAKSTISRWVKEVLSLAGVDTDRFSPGSTRSASVSALARRGASIAQILGAGDWSNLGTYQRFYSRTVDDTPVGRLILEAAVSFSYSSLLHRSIDIYYFDHTNCRCFFRLDV